jgi:hypothetical protein
MTLAHSQTLRVYITIDRGSFEVFSIETQVFSKPLHICLSRESLYQCALPLSKPTCKSSVITHCHEKCDDSLTVKKGQPGEWRGNTESGHFAWLLLDPTARYGVSKFSRMETAESALVVTIHDLIFFELPQSFELDHRTNIAAHIFNIIVGADSINLPDEPEPPGVDPAFEKERYDTFAETVNVIAAAAAIANPLERDEQLVGLVEDLWRGALSDATAPPICRRIGYRVAEACLQHHPVQTNLFLLLLLDVRTTDE